MSGYRRVNYYELCRLCTSNKGTKIHLFKEEGKKKQIPSKIQICLRLQVNEMDSLPKFICNMCLEKLEGYFEFRSSCVNAESMLQSYAKNLSLNSDFVNDGKVYIKENKQDGLEETSSNKDLTLNNTNKIIFPISLDNIGVVQAATIHILPEKDVARLQGSLKGTVQVQQSAERITGEHSYSYKVQSRAVCDDSNKHQENLIKKKESYLKTTTTSTQMDKADLISQPTEKVAAISTEQTRNSMNQIGEFLKLKTVNSKENPAEYKCENCYMLFPTKAEKTSHSETCTDGTLKINEPISMADSEEDKTSIGPFNCEACGKIFKRKEHLSQHRRLHTGERPFRCSHCSNSFSRKEHLVRHILCHTGEKHYSCGICGKLFGRKDNVGKHMRTHQIKTVFFPESNMINSTSDKEDTTSVEYKCDLCSRNFITVQLLKEHLATKHTSPEKCKVVVLNANQPISLLEKALKQIPG